MQANRNPFRPNRRVIRSTLGGGLAGVLVLVAAGCQRPDRVDVGDLIPADYSRSGQVALPQQWWESFDDPALDAVIRTAFADSPTLAGAWDRLAQAEAIAKREGADLYPQLDADADAVGTWTRSSENGGPNFSRSFALGLVASYEVDLWGRIRALRDAAVLEAAATLSDLQATALTLSASVAVTWYRLAESLDQERLLADQIATNEQVLELIELRFQQGQVEAADVLRQRQLVESTHGDLDLQRGRTQVLRHQLAVLVGRPPRAMVAEQDPRLIELPPLPAAGVPAEVLQRRPDVREAYDLIMASDQDLAAAVANQYPRVGLSASWSGSSDELRNLFDNWLATLAANVFQPVFDGGRRAAEVERQEAIVSESINFYRLTILTALQETEDALSQEAAQVRFIESVNRQLETAQEVTRRTRDRYINGQFDYLRVLDALTSQQFLQREYLAARRDQIEFRIDLCRSLAGPVPLERPEPRALTSATPDGEAVRPAVHEN